MDGGPGRASRRHCWARHDELNIVSIPTRRVGRRAGTCTSPLERGHLPRPRDQIVSQRINVMAVDLYRAG
jgi:hypothetical protein